MGNLYVVAFGIVDCTFSGRNFYLIVEFEFGMSELGTFHKLCK